MEYSKKIAQWVELLESSDGLTTFQKLHTVNDFFNDIEYEWDDYNWDEKDYWATPFEFMQKGLGDCEDYAIGKYFTLKMMGIKEENLRLMHVTTTDGTAHMVLSVLYDNEYVILDNITDKIELFTERKDLPINTYSFNNDGFWSDGKLIGNGYKVFKTWRDVVERFREEYEEYTSPFEFDEE